MREGALTAADYRAAKRQLLADVHDATILQITPAVVSRSVRLLENGSLRAMDALPVACALEWRPDLFVTSDSRQLLAAGNAGLRTEYLGW
ncbi:MAG: type II toxin-antitoxin system VapC family toxin [Thermodesulfobacteriota bacterium]